MTNIYTPAGVLYTSNFFLVQMLFDPYICPLIEMLHTKQYSLRPFIIVVLPNFGKIKDQEKLHYCSH
jgi:hypothetical protein